MTSEMTRPTDDELEAMAQYHDWREDADSHTAAMLRACKSDPDYSDWNAAIEAGIVELRAYAPHQDGTGPEHDIGYAAGYHTAINRLRTMIDGASE